MIRIWEVDTGDVKWNAKLAAIARYCNTENGGSGWGNAAVKWCKYYLMMRFLMALATASD